MEGAGIQEHEDKEMAMAILESARSQDASNVNGRWADLQTRFS